MPSSGGRTSRGARALASIAFRRSVAVWNGVSGRAARKLESRRGVVLILMYHRVLPDDADASGIEPGMFVRASAFARHVEWLAARWQVRTLGDVLGDPPVRNDAPVAAITFDDGWRDNMTVAWPILRDRGVSATVFLVRDWVRSGSNGSGEFLLPEDVSRLAGEGMEFGAHTVTHPRLDRLAPDAIESEMLVSKDAVETWTRRECRTFAYPFGFSSSEAEAIAGRHFRGAVLAGGGWWTPGGDRARIPRVGMHQDMTGTRWMFETRLAQAPTQAA